MLGTLAHPRKPILLLLVFGVFLMIVGITALAQAVLVSTTYSQSILEAVVGGDAATVRALVNENLTAKDLEPGATTSSLAASIQRPLHDLLSSRVASPGSRSAGPTGRSSRPTTSARSAAGARTSADFAKAIAGTPTATFAGPSTSEALGTALHDGNAPARVPPAQERRPGPGRGRRLARRPAGRRRVSARSART